MRKVPHLWFKHPYRDTQQGMNRATFSNSVETQRPLMVEPARVELASEIKV
jgi:hypothetical protein